jgi:hypothetical protein
LFVVLTGFGPQFAAAVSPTTAELSEARRWAAANFEGGANAKPWFSFTYDGKPSAELLIKWEPHRATQQLDDKRTQHTVIFTDPKTGLVIRCVGVEYRDFPTVEWTLYFKNTGDKDTPILADIQAVDISADRPSGAANYVLPLNPVEYDCFRQPGTTEFVLHHNFGRQLLNDGLIVPIKSQPGAAVITYRKKS